MSSKKNSSPCERGKSSSDSDKHNALKEKKPYRDYEKAKQTIEELRLAAKRLVVVAAEKERVRRELAVVAEKLRLKAKQLAVVAKEKEIVRRKLTVTTEKLRLAAKRLVVVAEGKERVRRELAVSAEKLSSSEIFLNSVIEQSPESLWISDSEGTLIRMNQACHELFGITNEEAVGKYNLLKDNLIEEQGFMPLVEDVFREGKVARFILDYDLTKVKHVKIKRATHSTIDVVISPIKDMYGKVTNAIVQYKDITERKLAAEENIKIFKNAIDSSSDAIEMSTSEGKHYYQNKAFSEMFGDIGNDPPGSVYVDEKVGREVFQTIMAGGKWNGEVEMYGKGKKVLNILLRAYSIKDNTSKVICIIGIHTDITERKLAEEELLKVNAFNSALVENSPFGVMAILPNGSVDYVNPVMLMISGDSKANFKEMNVFKLPSYAKIGLADNIRGCFRGKSFFAGPLEYVSHFSKKKTVRNFTGIPMRDEAGKVEKVMLFIEDLTQIKEAEEKLQRSEKQYKALIETTDTGYVILDFQGKVTDANPEYVRLTGRNDRKEILGRSVVEWTADYEKEKNAKAVTECLKKGHIRNLEIDYIDSRGKITPVEINATVVKLDEKPQILTMCRDITERKNAEDALKESENRFRTIFEGATDGIIVADTKTKRFVFANPGICKLTGYSSDELLKLSVDDIHPAKDLPYVLAQVARQIKGEITLAGNLPVLRKDKQVVYCDVNSKVTKIGEQDYLVGFFRDITERKKADEELKKRTGELEKFNMMAVGRELRMVELKKRIKELEGKLRSK